MNRMLKKDKRKTDNNDIVYMVSLVKGKPFSPITIFKPLFFMEQKTAVPDCKKNLMLIW